MEIKPYICYIILLHLRGLKSNSTSTKSVLFMCNVLRMINLTASGLIIPAIDFLFASITRSHTPIANANE